MTTIKRTLSILAMAAIVGFACTPTDAMARGHNHHNNKHVVHVQKKVVKHHHRGHNKTVVKHVVRQAPRHVVHHRGPVRPAYRYASPFGLSINHGHVSLALPGLYIN